MTPNTCFTDEQIILIKEKGVNNFFIVEKQRDYIIAGYVPCTDNSNLS